MINTTKQHYSTARSPDDVTTGDIPAICEIYYYDTVTNNVYYQKHVGICMILDVIYFLS